MRESSPMERGLVVLVTGKFDMSEHCPGSQEGQVCPGGHQEVVLHLKLNQAGLNSLLCYHARDGPYKCCIQDK